MSLNNDLRCQVWLVEVTSHLHRSQECRDTATLNKQEQSKWDGMKGGCRTSWILQDKTIELSGCKCALFFTEGDEGP